MVIQIKRTLCARAESLYQKGIRLNIHIDMDYLNAIKNFLSQVIPRSSIFMLFLKNTIPEKNVY